VSLPENNTEWPPKPWDHAYRAYAENEAWYLGDTAQLERIYRRHSQARVTHYRHGQSMSGGVAGAVSQFFWGRPVPTGQHRTRLHVPAAADLATLSSDLVFSEPPEVQLGETSGTTQERLNLIANSNPAHAMFNRMGELKAALGAVVITTEWDKDVADHAWLECTAADVVIPTFRKGKLVSCVMWTAYQEGSVYWRHLESHQVGRIEHALYQGTVNNLGTRVPLTERPETSHLAKLVGENAAIETHINRLTASYNVNMPTRSWRKLGALANAGRSDFAGLHGLFDALDETYSSWMRDLKHGGGKVIVPESMLQSPGRGHGAFFDESQEFFTGVNSPGDPNSIMIEQVQFKIRVDEHERTALALYREILRAAGYSQSAWGDYGASNTTATEVEDRDKASERTRDKKTLYDAAAISEQASVALEIDGRMFRGKGGGAYDRPTVVFPPASQIDPEKNARTIQLLAAAGAASTETLVKRAQPDWDDNQVAEEVTRIQATKQLPDPATFTGF